MSLSILARGERLRERLLADVADLRITGFQSPAEDEKEEGLSLDRLGSLRCDSVGARADGHPSIFNHNRNGNVAALGYNS